MYSYFVNECSNNVYLLLLPVLFVCLFILVLCFSLVFSSTSCCSCRYMHCEYKSIIKLIKIKINE